MLSNVLKLSSSYVSLKLVSLPEFRWIEYGKRYRPCDCSRDKVKVDMTTFVRRFQPERLEAWVNKTDIAPHPEDPPEVAAEIMERAREGRKEIALKNGKFHQCTHFFSSTCSWPSSSPFSKWKKERTLEAKGIPALHWCLQTWICFLV